MMNRPSDGEIFPRFSDSEYARREAAVRREMAARGLDAVIAVGDAGSRGANHANVYWLTNWVDPMVAYVILTRDAGPFLFASNPLFLHSAKRAGRAAEITAAGAPARRRSPDRNQCELGGCSGQIQRPFAIGAEPTSEYQRLYELASQAYENIAGWS